MTCVVCGKRASNRLCPACQRSYDRHRDKTDGGSTWDVIEWAAKLARRFARK